MNFDAARSRVDHAPDDIARAQARAVIQLYRCQGQVTFQLLRDILGMGIDPGFAEAFREIDRRLVDLSRRLPG